jgi:hypothetical protein
MGALWMFGLVLTSGCGGEAASARDQSNQLVRKLVAESPPGQVVHPAWEGDLRFRLFVDASQSMQGYFDCTLGESREISTVLARLTTDLRITTATLFGVPHKDARRVSFVERPIDRAMRCPETYSWVNNPDAELVEALVQDTSSVISVYLTDGVQSAGDADTPSPTARALEEWLRAGRGLAILAFRGTFRGRGWSEEHQQWVYGINVPDRPFYFFFFGPSDAAVQAALQGLSADLRSQALQIRLSARPHDCEIKPTRRGRVTGTTDPPWVLLRTQATQQMEKGLEPLGDFTCRVPDGYPTGTVLARVHPTYYQFRGGRFQVVERLPLGADFRADSVQRSDGGSSTVLLGRVPSDQAARYGLYALRVRVVPGDVRDEVRRLSIDQDGRPEDFDRTYRFLWLIDRLLVSRLEREPLELPYFITLQYR